MTKVANVIDVLVGAGANDIGGINFTVTQASKHLDEAREKAIADARRKAEIYAKAAGVTLGEPISISEEGAPVPVYRGKMAAPMAAGAPVAQGEETLSVTVSVSWAIKADAVAAVIASEAKQSMPPQADRWIASSLSLLAMTARSPPPAPASAPRTAPAESSPP